MATSGREARRKRIVEGGSDRLALITGRIQTLPNSLSSPKSHLNFTDIVSSPTISRDDQDLQPYASNEAAGTGVKWRKTVSWKNLQPKDLSPTHSDHKEDKESEPISNQHTPPHCRNNSAPPAQNSDTSKGASEKAETKPLPELSGQPPSSVSCSSAQESRSEPQRSPKLASFTRSQISSAIGESEMTRRYCSAGIALLVVLSNVGFPLLGSNVVKRIISFKPLYMLLLTNLTIVSSRLLAERQRDAKMMSGGGETAKALVEDDWTDQVGNAFEAGFLVQKAISALFVDFSIYAAIVVSFLSI